MVHFKAREPTQTMTPFNRTGALAAIFAAALHFGAAAACAATTAAEVFKTHEAEIATNRCVAVGGYVFGVGRALSRQGGDAVGFSKARLLAQGKILAYATGNAPCPEGLEIVGLETIFERREAPEHYLVVVAAPEAAIEEATREGLRRQDGEDATEGLRRQDDGGMAIEEYKPRGYWEENGIKANETLSEAQFL